MDFTKMSLVPRQSNTANHASLAMTETNALNLHRIWIVYAIVLVLMYVVFRQYYRVEVLDDAWSLSWAHGWWHGKGVYDHTFGYLKGEGGTALFGRGYVVAYAVVATLLGWSREVATGFSSVLTLASAAIWFDIVRRLGYRKQFALTFALVMLLLEAYYAMSQSTRQEAPAFLLASLSFWLFLKLRYTLSGLALGVAVEIHPFALAGGFWILAYLVVLWPQMKLTPRVYVRGAAWFFFGLGLGFLYWLYVHAPNLSELNQLGNRVSGGYRGNAISEYYFGSPRSWRHWPELMIVLASLVVFIAQRSWKKHPLVLALFAAVILCTILIPRGNLKYIVYVYPAAILLILVVADELRSLHRLLWILLLIQVPQYAVLFWKQRTYDHSAYLAELAERVPEGPLIYGHPNAWFALLERNFVAYGYFNRAGLTPDRWPDIFILIENHNFERWWGKRDIDRSKGMYEWTLLNEWSAWDKSPVRVWKLEKNKDVG
jgi:hypothetical protein